MKKYDDKIHLLGRVASIIVLSMIIMVPTIISIRYQIFPPLKNFLSGFLQVAMIYIPISIAEFFTFVPILGKGGSYLAFMTGNLTNLKIPCASIALENSPYKKGSEEAEIIATISIATSAIVTIIVVFIGLILIIPLKPILEIDSLKIGFQNILPALFGSLGAYFFTKQWKLAIIPVIVSIIFAFIIIVVLKLDFNSIQGLLIPILGLISCFSAVKLYKRNIITKEDIKE